MTEPDDIETQLPDLTGVTLADLTRLDLTPERRALLEQVERPRPNIGSGPPGRAD